MNKLIGIIGGKGKMGKYFADFFKRNSYKVIISDKDTKLTNVQLARKADVVVVSVPIGITKEVINEIAPHMKKSGLILDLTSLKVFPMEAMKKSQGSYIGCHPLFGPSTAIEGQMVVICKGRGDEWYKWWKSLLKKNKVDVRELTAKKHDTLMAYIQSLTHFSYLALADALRESGINMKDLLTYQSPIYRIRLDVMGRILNQDPNLYAQIQIQNPNSLKVMKSLVNVSNKWISIVEKKQVKQFESRFNKSSKYFGNFKKLAMEESDFLISQVNRKKMVEGDVGPNIKPDSSHDIVTLGPKNTFSGMATIQYNPQAKIWYANSITEVFEIVKKGIIKQGIVPVENNLGGRVAETAENLFTSNLKIQDELSLSIHHCLCSLEKLSPTVIKKVKTVYAHPQAAKQCKNYLKKHFPKASIIKVKSNVAAIKKLIEDNCYDAVAIAPKKAIQSFRVNLIKENIEDYKFNTTRFIIIGKSNKVGIGNKTSIVFYFKKDSPGSLYKVLGAFDQAKINMTKIESAVNPKIPGGNLFYIDFEGSFEDKKVKQMLVKIKKIVEKLKILGCY